MSGESPDPLEAALDVPPYEDKPIPRWQKLTAAGVLVGIVAILVIFHGRIHDDLWPLDASRVAPNILASLIQWAALFLAAVLIWPPTRRRLHRFVDRKLAPVHAHLTHLRHHHEASAARQEHLIRQNAHIIEHSTMSNVTHDGVDLTAHPFTGEKLTEPPTPSKPPAKKAAAKKAAPRKDPDK